MKKILISILLTACGNSESKLLPQTPPTPIRNFVCERVKRLNDKAVCEPEYSDVGNEHLHTAVVTVDKEPAVSCGMGPAQLSVVCGPLFVVQKQPEQQPEPKPQTPVKAPTPKPTAPATKSK